MNLESIWSVLEETFEYLLEEYGAPAMMNAAAELNLQPGWIIWAGAIELLVSEPISTAKVMRIFPYGLASTNESHLASAAQQGYLIADGGNGYRPTEAGINAARRVLHAPDSSITHLQPISNARLQRLVDYLTRLAEASRAAPPPPPNFYLSHHRNMHPGKDAPLLVLFVFYYKELDSYRVDTHIAAWQAYDIEGHAWRMLTYIWRGEANTFDRLHEALRGGGLSRDDVAQDIQELTTRGWVREESGEYQLTAEGRKIREEAEETTNHYYFAPWACLSEKEQEDLLSLTTQLRESLRSSSK